MKIAKYPLVLAAVSAAMGVLACLVVANLLPERRELEQPLPTISRLPTPSSGHRWERCSAPTAFLETGWRRWSTATRFSRHASGHARGQ